MQLVKHTYKSQADIIKAMNAGEHFYYKEYDIYIPLPITLSHLKPQYQWRKPSDGEQAIPAGSLLPPSLTKQHEIEDNWLYWQVQPSWESSLGESSPVLCFVSDNSAAVEPPEIMVVEYIVQFEEDSDVPYRTVTNDRWKFARPVEPADCFSWPTK